MSITNTDICNMALSHIAVGGIISMDESSEAAKQCKIHYEHTRRRMLGMYNWNFAARETKLALLDKTVPGFAYVYAYPEECLKIYYVKKKAWHHTKKSIRVIIVSQPLQASVVR